MKKYLLTILLNMSMTLLVFAQKTNTSTIEATYTMEIKVDYEKAIKEIPQNFRSQLGPSLKAEIEAGIFLTYILKSNQQQSTFTLEQKVNNNQGNSGAIANNFYMMDSKPTYKDFTVNPNVYYKEVDFGTKQILIKDTIPDFKWKISREKTEIAGYQVTKAEGIIMDSIPISAWYTTQIPVKDGPYYLAGLPGLIIKAEFEDNGGKNIYTLKELKLREKDFNFNLPTKGDIMSGKEYIKFIQDFQKKIKEQFGNGVDTK